jgi:uncharacterized protein (DUF2126 family)
MDLKEAQPAENVTPENSRLKDPEERARIARVFARGLTEPAGFVLPIQRWQGASHAPRWRSEKWKPRRGKLFPCARRQPCGLPPAAGSLPYVPPRNIPIPTPPTHRFHAAPARFPCAPHARCAEVRQR